ncbi:MAG: 5-methyltetrahydropteroyltriglutamate--homocysteine S-methyltransferase, partial [Acidimicrobiales bacterium]
MTTRTSPPFRADHVGSLLRPPELLEARRQLADGAIDATELAAREDAAIRSAVALQEEIGLRAVTDGEFRRTSWHMDFIYQLGGIERGDEQLKVAFKNSDGGMSFTTAALHVRGKVRLEETIFADAFRFLQSCTTTAVPKLTIPSPSMVHYRGGNSAIDPAAYPDPAAFWEDLSAAYRAQLDGVYALGCRYLQLDDTSLAYINDPAQRAH